MPEDENIVEVVQEDSDEESGIDSQATYETAKASANVAMDAIGYTNPLLKAFGSVLPQAKEKAS